MVFPALTGTEYRDYGDFGTAGRTPPPAAAGIVVCESCRHPSIIDNYTLRV